MNRQAKRSLFNALKTNGERAPSRKTTWSPGCVDSGPMPRWPSEVMKNAPDQVLRSRTARSNVCRTSWTSPVFPVSPKSLFPVQSRRQDASGPVRHLAQGRRRHSSALARNSIHSSGLWSVLLMGHGFSRCRWASNFRSTGKPGSPSRCSEQDSNNKA